MPIPRQVYNAIDELVPLPVTANRLISVLGGDDVSLSRVADLLEHDQVIAARVLRMARSTADAGRMPVSDVRDALVRLVAKSIGVGLGAEGMNFNVDPGLSHRLGLSFSGFSRVCIQTASWLKEVRGPSRTAA